MTGKKQAPKTITQEMNELHAQLVTGNVYSGQQALGSDQLHQGAYAQAAYQGQPDYYQLSYLKRPDDGALWERHTEYFPTHDESTTRALALSASGAVCVRTLPRYWMG